MIIAESVADLYLFGFCGFRRLTFIGIFIPVLALLGNIVRTIIEIEIRIEGVRRQFYIRYFLMPFKFLGYFLRILLCRFFVLSELIKVMYPVSLGRVLRAFRYDFVCNLAHAPRLLARRKNLPFRNPRDIVGSEFQHYPLHGKICTDYTLFLLQIFREFIAVILNKKIVQLADLFTRYIQRNDIPACFGIISVSTSLNKPVRKILYAVFPH